MRNAIGSIVIAVAVIITALILGNAWTKGKKPKETIDVTGLAQHDFTSDLIVWGGSFSRRGFETKAAYDELKLDAGKVRQYLLSKGVQEKEIVFSAIDIQRNYRTEWNDERSSRQVFDGYTLTQSVSIESKEVEKIENLSRAITELIDIGVEFYSQSPQFFYTKLSELKIDLLAKATADAKLRAEKIAQNAGSDIGNLTRADMGIFQITGQNSTEDYSYGGTFNTMNKKKTASITVHLEFEVD